MARFNKQKVVVVGGAGFVGSNLVKSLIADQAEKIIVIDNLLSAERENIPDHPSVYFIHASINDEKVLHELTDDIDYVFHLATFHGNQNSLHDPIMDHEHNTVTTLNLFDRLKHFKQLKKVVYASAGCVVAEKTFAKAEATTEDAMPSMYLDSPYQISKIIGEFYANFYFKQHGLPVVKARFQNIYGPGEVLGAGQWRGTAGTIWRNVTPIFIYQALKQMPLSVENGGVATRDFIYVADLAEGLIRCALNAEPSSVYNLASGVETSIKSLAEKINHYCENPTPISLKPKRDWDHSGTRFGSTEKALNDLGFAATTDLDSGLQQTIEWTKQNFAWIERCIHQHDAHLTE